MTTYVTVAIPYVNAEPHLGYAYELVLADVYARGRRLDDDDTQVIYVWFDALTNYISALGFGDAETSDYGTWWRDSDRRVHVIGKGILRFHAVYWPAFLASAGEPAPTRVQVHPYLTASGEKLSKSTGNTVDPVRVVAEFSTDALRWWFASDVAAVPDTDFTTERLSPRQRGSRPWPG